MKIPLNLKNNIIISNKKISESALKSTKNNTSFKADIPLSSIDTVGQSLLNANLPVSYAKIGEISVPGVKEKASLFKLSNGQRVVILPKKGPTYIRTSFNVGSLNEPDDKRGISHFIEHNLFNGSKGLEPDEYNSRITELGGSTNAYTNTCETQYYLNLQLLNDNSLEEAIKLNSAQTQFPTFPKEQLDKEKEPVKQEIDMCKDVPANQTWSIMLKNMFSIQSTSDDLVIGTKDNINRLTRDDVLNYYNTWYTPDNAITVITGDVDVNETINLVSKYYNKKADSNNISERKYQQLIPLNKPVRCDIKQSSNPNTTISMGIPIPEGTSVRELEKIKLMLSVLTSSESQLSQKLDKYGTKVYFSIERLSSDTNAPKVISTNIELPEKYAEKVLKVIYENINSLINTPPDYNMLKTLIDNQINDLNNDSEYSGSISSQLIDIVNNNDLNYYENFKNNISSVTPNEISDLARKYLDLNKVSICVAHPSSVSDEEIINNHANNNKSATISFGKSYNPSNVISEELTQLKEYHLNNNMEAAVINVDNIADSVMKLNIQSDPNDNLSMAAMMVLTEILNRGSLYKDNVTYSKLQKENNCAFDFTATNEGIYVSAFFNPNKINETLALIKETLLSANLTQGEFDRAKKIVKDTIANSTYTPDDLLSTELNPNSKFFADKKDQLKELDNLTLNDLVQIYYGMLYNAQANVTLAAPIKENPNIEYGLVNSLSQGFPMFRPFVKGKSLQGNRYTENTREKVLTAAENNAQASIIQSFQYKLNGNLEDELKIKLLDIILGSGGMSSRLFQDLRNNEKLAYTVGSQVLQYGDRGEMQLYIDTSTDPDITPEASPENINKALAGFKRNVDKLKTEFITDKELESAKTMYKTMLLNDFESNGNKSEVADNITNNIYGREYYAKSIEIIDKITKQDIMDAANYIFKNPPVNAIVASQKTLDSLNLK